MTPKEQIYRLADSFLVEAKNQYGEDRSLERLNQDRHLFVENMMKFVRSEIERMLVEADKVDKWDYEYKELEQWINKNYPK
jgi:hypothetical protein